MLSTGNADSDAALAEAITSRRRRLVWSLTADLGRTGRFDHPWSDLSALVSEITVNRSLAGDLPAETTLVEGFASAALTATLEGRIGDLDVIDLFGAYRGNPQWAGVALRFDLGLDTRLGPIMLRQFTGTIRAVTTHTAARTVTLTAADGAESLRAGVTLPVAAADGTIVAKLGENVYRLWMNPQWVIDNVLRRNGIYNSPAPIAGAIFSATLHGSMVPEIGYGGSPLAEKPDFTGPVWTPSTFGLLAANGGENVTLWGSTYIASDPVTFAGNTGLGLGLWVHHGAGAVLSSGLTQSPLLGVDTGNNRAVWLLLSTDGTIQLQVLENGTTYTVTYGAKLGALGWRYIGVHVHFVGNAAAVAQLVVTWNIGGTISTANVNVGITPTRSVFPRAIVELYVARPICNAQVWNANIAPAAGAWPTAATRVSDIDPGLGELTHLPVVRGRDSWDVLKEVATAEYAAVGFTEDGRFYFYNRDTLTTRRTAAPTSTVDGSVLKDVAATTSMDAVRNEITINATPSYAAPTEVIFAATSIDEFVVGPSTSRYRAITLPEDTITAKGGVYGELSFVSTAMWNNDIQSGFCCSRADGTGGDVTKVFVGVAQITATQLDVTVVNQNTFAIRLSTSGANPQPALHIPGIRLAAQIAVSDTITDTASIQTNKRRSLSLDATPWRHRLGPLRTLAGKLLAELASPRPVLDEIPVIGDPRRTLLDTVTLADPTGIGTTTASITAITRRLSTSDGLTDSLTVRPTT